MMSAQEREAALRQMRGVTRVFYAAAVQTGCHPFIEFNGLMNEYIKCCAQAHAEGVDFTACNVHTGAALPMRDYETAYVNEKLGCIFTGRIKI